MDNNSNYIALAGKSFEDFVKPKMREWEKDKHNWFPRTDIPENAKYDYLKLKKQKMNWLNYVVKHISYNQIWRIQNQKKK